MKTGAVYSYGDAVYFGGINNAGPNQSNALVPGDTVTGFASHPSAQGYIATTSGERVYAFGASRDLGGRRDVALTSSPPSSGPPSSA